MMRMRGKAFGALTILLVSIIVLCTRGTAMSRERTEHDKRNRHYAVLEQEYIERTQKLLEEEGFKDCGVNLRWVAEGDGSREYTILLHHRKLRRMTEEEKSVLAAVLSAMEFHDESCSFCYEIGS